MTKTLYIDMDNTLLDFSITNEHNALKDMYKKGYFRNLNPLPYAIEAVKELNETYNIYILSACVKSEYCKKEKKEWIKEHLPFINQEQIILTEIGQNKNDFATVKGALLDDYGKNLREWKKGLSIRFDWAGIKKEQARIINWKQLDKLKELLAG